MTLIPLEAPTRSSIAWLWSLFRSLGHNNRLQIDPGREGERESEELQKNSERIEGEMTLG